MAFGLRPVRMLGGAAWNGNVVTCLLPDDYATAVFVGDPVIEVAAGSATLGTTATFTGDFAESGGTYPVVNVASAASTNRIYGVIVAIEPVRSDLSVKHGAASTVRVVRVAVADPMLVYEVQGDAAGTALTIADVGRTISLVSGTGSTSTGYSGWAINDDTNTTSTLQCRIVGLSNRVGNLATVGTTKAVWEVVVAQPSVFPTQLGAGI